jgi:hypothetical protein
LPRIPEYYRGFAGTGRRKKDNRDNENSKHGAGKLEHLYEAIAIGKAAAVLAASIFHFGKISIPVANRHLKERAIPVEP